MNTTDTTTTARHPCYLVTIERVKTNLIGIEQDVAMTRALLIHAMREARADGHTLAAIADAAGVSVQYVSKVCKEEQ